MSIAVQRFDGNVGKNTVDKIVNRFMDLFNDKDNLLYLSLINIPFDSEMVQNWIDQDGKSGVEYYLAYKEDGSILGILTIKFYSFAGYLKIDVNNSILLKDVDNVMISQIKKRKKIINENMEGIIEGLSISVRNIATDIITGDTSVFGDVMSYKTNMLSKRYK